ncbi:MAG: GxxExxY protein [Candidatus Nealsonbacteria bacterium CG_4_10_14_0_2_um_filter_38_17]|uniref:GxxExxY protein n=2 Tax=Candidatus Nealsoniibacteriota TaxID=1817911 RepID=A0A2M7UWY6_9BACT|nr:MAG: GxxExxY protein [Candidatus Nealsonbacteria bacterium CG23_combo_of_CG06-09_8_20_14_all_38_19]PIZ88479.1 MAG: GxxExxY protein [Candidatus Nealsonbacteria bacterium CG_4_10_14_0_2_um_filter_38_17]
MKELVFPELSYKVIGIAFKVFNSLGYGHQEKYFQRAIALELDKQGIRYEKEKEIKLNYNNHCIGKYFLDFLIEDKIILELKVVPEFKHTHLKRTLEYLDATKVKLAILVYFTRNGVKYRRIINPRIKIY